MQDRLVFVNHTTKVRRAGFDAIGVYFQRVFTTISLRGILSFSIEMHEEKRVNDPPRPPSCSAHTLASNDSTRFACFLSTRLRANK